MTFLNSPVRTKGQSITKMNDTYDTKVGVFIIGRIEVLLLISPIRYIL